MNAEYKGKWQATMMDCDNCGHKWAAAHPCTCEYLECPLCGSFTPAPFLEEGLETEPPKDSTQNRQ